MTAQRPRSFAWVWGLRGPEPQILFDDPRVGCREGIVILAQTKLNPNDTRGLDELAAAYPAPEAA